VRGFELEQSATHPRILVDDDLYIFFKSKTDGGRYTSFFEGTINRDKDGELYFDFYEAMRTYGVDAKKYQLVNITKHINNMLTVKQDDKRVWKKWYWFKEYHNQKIRIWTNF
jgi:hypothetical protein